MDLGAFLERIVGRWKGTYSLCVNPDQGFEDSATIAEMRATGSGQFFILTYTWGNRERSREGVFLLGGRAAAFATWVDSWHMANDPMVCTGSLENEEKLVLNGHYSAGPVEWGWRTELIHEGRTTFVMKAFNISPDGEEVLAVRSEMESVAS